MKNPSECKPLSETMRLLAAKSDPEKSGKWLPLWIHLTDVAGIMEKLVQKWLPRAAENVALSEIPEKQILPLSLFLGCVHDLGKATVAFQSNILNELPEIHGRLSREGMAIPVRGQLTESKHSPHALASEAILCQKGCPEGIASIAGAHHGKPSSTEISIKSQLGAQGYAVNYYFNDSNKEAWNAVWDEIIGYALELSGFDSVKKLPTLTRSSQVVLTGLLIIADWLASNTSYFPLVDSTDLGSADLYPERIDKAWRKISLPSPWTPTTFDMDADTFAERFGFAPNAVQREVLAALKETNQPGLMIIEAQMGIGKTEAALAAAEVLASRKEAGGIFFGLPTQATANGIFPRLEVWAEKQSNDTVHGIRLAHAMAALNDDYASIFKGTAQQAEDEMKGLTVHPWLQGRKQALLSNFVIGTVDQLLLAALKQKHFMLRHLGLAGKVVIIDECHAYDTYMNVYLDMALQWLGSYGVPVILLSATLPASRRAELVDAYQRNQTPTAEKWRFSRAYPLMTWTDGQTVRQTELPKPETSKSVKIKRIEENEMIPRLKTAAIDCGGCAAVIVNTVSRAQKIAKQIKESIPDAEVLVLHSQFLMPDRAEREKELIRRLGKGSTPEQRKGLIVVGTQVLEQSLDIDVDLLITDLCPMDLLLQRIGREHRHPRLRPNGLEEAECLVLGALDELDKGSSSIYGDWLLLRTRDLLQDKISLPDDIPTLVEETYDFDANTATSNETYSNALKKYRNEKKERSSRAEAFRLSPPPRSSRRFGKTMTGLLNTNIDASDARAEAAVRDGGQSIEVLVFVLHSDKSLHFLPWQNGGAVVASDRIPAQEDLKLLMRERLKLPARFSKDWRIDRVIAELEKVRIKYFSEWEHAPGLADELVLLLDENLDGHLDGDMLHYCKETGLVYQTKEETNERD